MQRTRPKYMSFVYNEGGNTSEIIVTTAGIDSHNRKPNIDSHASYYYPPQPIDKIDFPGLDKGLAWWGNVEEKEYEGWQKLAEGLYVFPKPYPRAPNQARPGPEIYELNSSYKIRELYRSNLDGDLLCHIVLPPKCYINRDDDGRFRNNSSDEITVVTRRKTGRQTITCVLYGKHPNEPKTLDETIVFKGPNEEGFNRQEDKFQVYKPGT
jgi:hypothetical protein